MKAQKRRERAAAAAERYPGNIPTLFELWKKTAAWDRPDAVRTFTLSMRVSRKRQLYTSGRCYGGLSRRITMTVGTSAADAYMVILHELAHADKPRAGHSGPFYESFLRAARSVTGLPCEVEGRPTSQSTGNAVRKAFQTLVDRGILPADERPEPPKRGQMVEIVNGEIVITVKGAVRDEFEDQLRIASEVDGGECGEWIDLAKFMSYYKTKTTKGVSQWHLPSNLVSWEVDELYRLMHGSTSGTRGWRMLLSQLWAVKQKV